MVKRVLIIGGYGNFGSYIARSLAPESGVRLLIAGRSMHKAQKFIAALTALNTPEAVALDISDDLTKTLATLRPDIVIHTTGPFQSQGYAVAEACVAQGSHYIDLADAREFVTGVTRFHEQAGREGLLIVSGASSVPCLTAAIIDDYRPQFATLDRVEYGISAAQQTNRGLATTAAILSYVGKPFLTWSEGRSKRVFGWQDLHSVKYPSLGRRWFGNCDVPDLELFPGRYPGVRTLDFSAGTELRILHAGLWLLSWLVRWKIIPSLSGMAGILLAAAAPFDFLGSGRSGFHMFITGTDHSGRSTTARFYLIARSGHGPYVPCMPAIHLARGLADGSLSISGAGPCVDLIDLGTYLAALRDLDISVIRTVEHPT